MKQMTAIALITTLFNLNAHSQVIPVGTYTELSKFPGLSQAYVQNLPTVINNLLMSKEEAYHKNIKSNCSSRFDVQYISKLTPQTDAAVQDFETGFIGIDVTLCFINTTAEKVMALFSDAKFQASSVSTIKSSVEKDGMVCEKTTAPTIGNSHYCYVQQSYSQPGYVMGFAFNIWNDSIHNADAPVYFREILATANQTGNVTEFHLQTLVRGPKLNFIQKMFAKSAITSEQQSVYEKMKQRLQ